MDIGLKEVTNENALKLAIVEIKLQVNRKLYEKKIITEEMFAKAKELIVKGT